ncbi:MAG: hypothetical protein K2W78_11180 [Xanthobacteraceae bacterium]|nr:hypothetical protein [Xanthobacteraceae bacterium]
MSTSRVSAKALRADLAAAEVHRSALSLSRENQRLQSVVAQFLKTLRSA